MASDYGWYYDLIQNAFHSRWSQPRGVTTSEHISTRAALVIAPDGRVLSARIINPSGVAAMDRSIDDALRSVDKISAVPRGLSDGGNLEITIRFKLD